MQETNSGETLTNSRGRLIDDILATIDLSLLNDGSPTHYHLQTNTESCIDLTLISPDAIMDLTWSVSEDLYSSDHYPIIIESTIQQTTNIPITCYNFDKADWTLFRRHTIISNEQFDPTIDIDSQIAFLML